MTTQLWYVARAGGLLSWVLLAAGVVWGLALSSRVFGRRPRPAWLLDLHRYLGGLAVTFVGVHVAAIALDTYVHFGLADVLVPFAGSWHPAAVAWGIVAMYLLLAVELTSLIRARLPLRVWRQVHYLSFPLFVLATVHALSAGTDRTNPAMQLGVLSVCALVALLAVLRAKPARRAPRPAEPPRPRPDLRRPHSDAARPAASLPAAPLAATRTPVRVTVGGIPQRDHPVDGSAKT
jgi:DMSO/TMAO reductase YedYZ heme-binding membrane subunit